MKEVIKKHYKVIIGIVVGLIVSTMGTYAAEQVLTSDDVLYNDNETVQAAIDDLYKKAKELTGEGDTKYTESILNGADPVLGKGMIPVTIDAKGTVKYANLKTPWYSYEEKRWANAVILSSGNYKVGDVIPESAIQSYFVWIPRFKYKVWNYTMTDGYQSTFVNTQDDVNSIRRLTGGAQIIDVVFENNKAAASNATKNGEYLTHPAFTAFGVNGLWIAKFEASGGENNVTIKPGATSWRSATVGQFWKTFYNYKRELDSHMIKNTEWGAAAYLSHSAYGIGNEVNINNNSDYKTGYSAAPGTDQSSYTGTYGNSSSGLTLPYNTATGYLASTTGNITGIYDMSGGAHEYVAGYMDGYGEKNSQQVASGLTSTELNQTKYFDKYDGGSGWTSFSKKILGDATGEMGPFYYYKDKDGADRIHNAWYADGSYFVESAYPWFYRGGGYYYGVLAGQFSFHRGAGGASGDISSRLVLAPNGAS